MKVNSFGNLGKKAYTFEANGLACSYQPGEPKGSISFRSAGGAAVVLRWDGLDALNVRVNEVDFGYCGNTSTLAQKTLRDAVEAGIVAATIETDRHIKRIDQARSDALRSL